MKLMKRSRDTLTSVAPSSIAMQVTLRLAPVTVTGTKKLLHHKSHNHVNQMCMPPG